MADLTYVDAIIDAEAAAFEAVRMAHSRGKISLQVRNYVINQIGEHIHEARKDIRRSPDRTDLSVVASSDTVGEQQPKQDNGDNVP